jgi:hypothetical protein
MSVAWKSRSIMHLCLLFNVGLALAAGSFGGLVVPNMGQVKNGEGVLYYMDAPWGRLYATEQGLLLNVIQDVEQAPPPAMSSSIPQPWAAVAHDMESSAGPASPFATDPFLTSPFAKGGLRGISEVKRECDSSDPAPPDEISPNPSLARRGMSDHGPRGKFDHPEPRTVRQTGILLTLPGACWREVVPEDPRITKLNFFYGNDPKGWVTDVPTYKRLRIKNIFPGTDLVLEPKSSGFWRFEGLLPGLLDDLRAAPEVMNGAFGVVFSEGKHTQDNTMQAMPGKQDMPTVSREDGQSESQSVLWGTFLGGTGIDGSMCMLVDGEGDIVVAGMTDSEDFPILNPYDSTFNGGELDIFVAKLSADGSRLLWGTFIGGSAEDHVYCMAFDPNMSIVIAGETRSMDMPVTPGAFDTTFHLGEPDSGDIYAAKLTAAGNSLLWGTYIGGRNYDWILSCVIDKDGNVLLAGKTTSPDIPVPGGFDTSPSNYGDIYIAQLSGDGSLLLWATYLGGIYDEEAYAIALTPYDQLIIAGYSASPDIPVPNGYQTIKGQFSNIYIANIDIIENKVIWGTFIGGDASWGYSVAVNGYGEIYVVGGTYSDNMPTPNGYSSFFGGKTDIYAAELSSDGKNLLWGTYLPGSEDDYAWSCALDAMGNLFVAGGTLSDDIPVPIGYDTQYKGRGKMYIAKLAGAGRELLWGTYLGGSDFETTAAMAMDPWGNVIIAGYTMSPDFPVPNGYDQVYKGVDAVLAKLTDPGGAAPSLHVAAAAKAPGAYGTDWRTDGMLFNPGAATVCYNLHFASSGESGTTDTDCGASCLLGNSSRSFRDILGTACSIEGQSAGSITVNPTGKLLFTTRIYNQTENGTYGQFVEAVTGDQGLEVGDKAHVIALKQNSEYHTNLGFAEITSRETLIEIRIYDSSASQILSTSYHLPSTGWLQVGLSEMGISNLDLGRAEIEVISGGAVLPYASVVDNRTGDAIFIPAQKASAIPTVDHQIIPVVARSQGAYGTHWQSDLWLFNDAVSAKILDLTYRTADSSYRASLAMEPRHIMEIGDILSRLFPAAGEGAGSLHFTGASEVLIVSRTYNQSGSGTYGQFIPAGGPERLLLPGKMGWLLQLQCNDDYRTNVGFSEYSGQDADIEIDLFSTEGTLLARGNFTVPANRNMQISDIFSALGVPCGYPAAYARIVNISGGSIYPYASVVDNRTGDATFIPVME